MKHFVTLTLALALTCALPAPGAEDKLSDALKEYGLTVATGANPLQLRKNKKLSGATRSQHLIEAESSANERIEIKIIQPIDEDVAARTMRNEGDTLKKLYAAAQTPYMGDIAQALGGCPAQMGPIPQDVIVAKNKAGAIMGAVNDSMAFGACSREDAKFRGAWFAYYDPAAKALWTWRVFAPWKDAKKLDTDWLRPILSRFQEASWVSHP